MKCFRLVITDNMTISKQVLLLIVIIFYLLLIEIINQIDMLLWELFLKNQLFLLLGCKIIQSQSNKLYKHLNQKKKKK